MCEDDMNWRSQSNRPPPGPGWHNSTVKYTTEWLDWVTRMKNPKENVDPAFEYTFMTDLQRPLYCDPSIGKNISKMYRASVPIDDDTMVFGPEMMPTIPIYASAGWGVNLNKLKRDITVIPYNIHTVRRQQRELSPLMHWININRPKFERLRPKFASNRYVLKRILAMSDLESSFTFTAERMNGTIYLREIHPAFDQNSKGNSHNFESGALFESVMLEGGTGLKSNVYDLNETTYGIYLGNVGDISILFSAEIDGFWGTCSEAWNSPNKEYRPRHTRIAEVKTMHRDLFLEQKLPEFSTKMLSAWAQCYLIGVNRILFGIMNNRKVAHLQLVNMNHVLRGFKKISGLEDFENHRAHTSHLLNTLNSILENVTEDSPAQYIVTARYASTRNNRNNFKSAQVSKISPFFQTP